MGSAHNDIHIDDGYDSAIGNNDNSNSKNKNNNNSSNNNNGDSSYGNGDSCDKECRTAVDEQFTMVFRRNSSLVLHRVACLQIPTTFLLPLVSNLLLSLARHSSLAHMLPPLPDCASASVPIHLFMPYLFCLSICTVCLEPLTFDLLTPTLDIPQPTIVFSRLCCPSVVVYNVFLHVESIGHYASIPKQVCIELGLLVVLLAWHYLVYHKMFKHYALNCLHCMFR